MNIIVIEFKHYAYYTNNLNTNLWQFNFKYEIWMLLDRHSNEIWTIMLYNLNTIDMKYLARYAVFYPVMCLHIQCSSIYFFGCPCYYLKCSVSWRIRYNSVICENEEWEVYLFPPVIDYTIFCHRIWIPRFTITIFSTTFLQRYLSHVVLNGYLLSYCCMLHEEVKKGGGWGVGARKWGSGNIHRRFYIMF